MKKKNLKSLSLNKQTITNLSTEDMNKVKGGTSSNICWAIGGYITGKIVDATHFPGIGANGFVASKI